MMRKSHFIDVIYTHTEGEPTGIIHGGIIYPHGLDILGKRQFLTDNYDYVRTSIMREPRGHNDMFGVFLTPPSGPDTDGGMLWMDGERFVEMCGHGTIALGMVMATHGLVPKVTEPTTKIRLETPVGLVTVEVKVTDGQAEWTRFQNVPAFVLEKDITVNLPGYGEAKADLVFGGNFFSVIRWPDKDRPIGPQNSHLLSSVGVNVMKQINDRMDVRHPTEKHVQGLHFCTFWQDPDRADSLYRNVHVFSDGKLDRSPGGTGTSMMMAYFEAKGKMKVGDTIKSEGLLGSGQFEGSLIGETMIGDKRAVIPTVKGTAKVVGYAKWLLDPTDPVGRGFVVR